MDCVGSALSKLKASMDVVGEADHPAFAQLEGARSLENRTAVFDTIHFEGVRYSRVLRARARVLNLKGGCGSRLVLGPSPALFEWV